MIDSKYFGIIPVMRLSVQYSGTDAYDDNLVPSPNMQLPRNISQYVA